MQLSCDKRLVLAGPELVPTGAAVTIKMDLESSTGVGMLIVIPVEPEDKISDPNWLNST